MVEPTKTAINYQESCGSRLPCGLCLITNQMCPLGQTYKPNIVWTAMQTDTDFTISTCKSTDN